MVVISRKRKKYLMRFLLSFRHASHRLNLDRIKLFSLSALSVAIILAGSVTKNPLAKTSVASLAQNAMKEFDND